MLYLCIAFAVLLVVYLSFEQKNSFAAATALKVILSAYIAGIGIYAAASVQTFWCILLALGLVCAVPADFFLQYIKTDFKKYRVGIFAFGCMHVCLLTVFFLGGGIGWHEFVIFAALNVLLLVFQKSEKWNLGRARGVLTVYTVLVTLMASKAMSLFLVDPSRVTLFLALGGLFFFLSDLFLGIWDYYEDKFLFLALNRIIYFSGQLCFAFGLLSINTLRML